MENLRREGRILDFSCEALNSSSSRLIITELPLLNSPDWFPPGSTSADSISCLKENLQLEGSLLARFFLGGGGSHDFVSQTLNSSSFSSGIWWINRFELSYQIYSLLSHKNSWVFFGVLGLWTGSDLRHIISTYHSFLVSTDVLSRQPSSMPSEGRGQIMDHFILVDCFPHPHPRSPYIKKR